MDRLKASKPPARTNPQIPSKNRSSVIAMKPTDAAIAAAKVPRMTNREGQSEAASPSKTTRRRVIICSTGIWRMVKVRKPMVQSTPMGANSSAPRVRPAITSYT